MGEFAFQWEADLSWDGLVVPWGGEIYVERGCREFFALGREAGGGSQT